MSIKVKNQVADNGLGSSWLEVVGLPGLEKRGTAPNDFPIYFDFTGTAEPAPASITPVGQSRIATGINFLQNFQNGQVSLRLDFIVPVIGSLAASRIFSANGNLDYSFHQTAPILLTSPAQGSLPLDKKVCFASLGVEG